MYPSRKVINLLLMTIAFAVWMVFFYRIVFEGNQEENYFPTTIRNEVVYIIKPKKRDNYPKKGQKDPFITPYNHYDPKPKTIIPVVKAAPVPTLHLMGTIENQMAIIAFPDQSVKYMKVKEKVNDITVVKISRDKVQFKYNNKVYEIEN